jgi:GxxExxY protein
MECEELTEKIIESHEAQLANYLVATGKSVGLLINVAERNIEVKRTVRTLTTD